MKTSLKFISGTAIVFLLGFLMIAATSGTKLSRSDYYDKGRQNQVEELYDECVNRSASLKNLEAELKKNLESKQELIRQFNAYQTVSAQYDAAALQMIAGISDTALREHLKRNISASRNHYENMLTEHRKALTQIASNEIKLHNQHLALKISATLPLMEQFRKNNLPDIGLFRSLIKEQADLLQKMNKQIQAF